MSEIRDAIADFLGRVESCGIRYCVGGSFASMAHGNARQTNDLDLLFEINLEQSEALIDTLGTDYLIEPESTAMAVENRDPFGYFQVLSNKVNFKFDCFVSTGDAFSRMEIGRSVRAEILTDLFAWCATPEDIILRKLQWFELGNRVSDRQWNDIVGVLEVQKGRLEESYLDEWSTKLEIKDLLNRARSQVKPI